MYVSPLLFQLLDVVPLYLCFVFDWLLLFCVASIKVIGMKSYRRQMIEHSIIILPISHSEQCLLLTAMSQLKEKMQELNMYRSLLLQQISTIKMLCSNKEDNQVLK